MAMAFPDVQKGGDRKSSCFKQLDLNGYDKSTLSRARYVLRNNPIPEVKGEWMLLDGLFEKHAAQCAALQGMARVAA